MTNIIVTGGLGFLGQYLVAAILDKYPDAHIIIPARTSKIIFLPELNNNKQLEIHYNCDLLNPESVEDFFKKADTVFHVAAMISFQYRDKQEMIQQNRDGTKNILDLCRKHGINKLVYVGTTAAIGYNNSPDTPADETLQFDWKHGHGHKYAYTWSKYLADREVCAAAEKGLPVVIADPSSIYGPGDKKILPLIHSIKNGKLPAMMPGGLACVDVRDVANGLIAVAEHGKMGERYIITGGNYTQVQFITTIAEALNVSPPAKTFSMQTGKLLMPLITLMERITPKPPKITSEIFDMGFKFRYFSTKKAETELGWKPTYSLSQTFKDIAAREDENI